MPGALVGGSTPNASLILNQNSRKWEINVQLNRSFASQSSDYKYVYHILVPKNIGCNFNLFSSMSNNKTDFNHYAAYTDIALEKVNTTTSIATWGVSSDGDVHAHLQLDDSNDAEDSVGCFTKYVLTIYIADRLEICNMTFCINGPLFINCGSVTEGCDKFPVYVSAQDQGASNPGSSVTINNLDDDNMTTVPDE